VNEKDDLVELLGPAIDVTEQAQARIELEKACEEIKQRNGSCPPERERASRRGQYGSGACLEHVARG